MTALEDKFAEALRRVSYANATMCVGYGFDRSAMAVVDEALPHRSAMTPSLMSMNGPSSTARVI